MKIFHIFISLLLILNMSALAQPDSAGLDKVFGKKGSVQGMVYKITYPRSDLKVKVGEFSVAPGLALTSWIGILSMGNESMMMGDLVLLDSEEGAAVAKLVSSGLSITAIHNRRRWRRWRGTTPGPVPRPNLPRDVARASPPGRSSKAATKRCCRRSWT